MTPGGPRHSRRGEPNAGRVVARAFMALAGVALLVLGGLAYDSNRITLRDVLGLAACVVVGAVAALWLRRDRRLHDGGRQQ